MRPNLVPVCGNFATSSNSRGELQSAGAAVVIASDTGVGRVLNGIAIIKSVSITTSGRKKPGFVSEWQDYLLT